MTPSAPPPCASSRTPSRTRQLKSAPRSPRQIVIAMKAHDPVRTTTLRLIKNAIKNKAIEKRAALTPAEEQQALATMIKQRRDSIEQFTKGNRPELAAAEGAEIVVIEEVLPKALD